MKNTIKEFLSKFNNLIIATTVAIILVTVFIICFLYIPVVRGDINQIEVIVEEGDSLVNVAEKLQKSGLIKNKSVFIVYIKIRGEETKLKAGRYIFSKSLNIPTIAKMIVSGKLESDDIKIVIPEGSNVWEIDKILIQSGLISEGQFSSKYYNREGYLFPDTYSLRNYQLPITNLQSKDLAEELKVKMMENFNKKIADLLKDKGPLYDIDLDRIIIIASILEKEVRREEDMKLVSGIIRKRMKLGMPLQIDATVIYGACLRNFQFLITNLKPIKNCDVTFQGPAIEIPIDGPYNTYTRKGLPSAPISNPGLQAIEAALNPTSSDYLYYLSTRDGGQIIYSKIPAEHAANRRKYLGI